MRQHKKNILSQILLYWESGKEWGAINLAFIFLFLASLACNTVTRKPPVSSPSKLPPTPVVLTPTPDAPTEHRWAIRSFTNPETWADPDMADGESDVIECGDILRAWAPLASSTPAVLTLTYAASLLPTQVNIIQSGNPGNILRVEVLDSASGQVQLIYEGGQAAGGACPETLSLAVNTDFAVDTIIITVAASDSPTQIDAVELVGSLPAFIDIPMYWQVSIPSNDSPEKYGLPGGIAADGQGNIYLADGAHGIYTFDLEGNKLQNIPSPEYSNLTDVINDPSGYIIVTDSGYGWFIVLSTEGAQIVAGGEDFDDDGPFAIAVNPLEGDLYLLDKGRIRVYAFETAKLLRDLPLEAGSYRGLAFDFAGNLYTASPYGESVLKIDPNSGEILDILGVAALAKTTSRDLAIDEAGNIYVLVNFSPGDTAVYMLDPHGNLLKRFGRLVYQPPGGEGLEGALFDPISLTVTPDGRFVIVCSGSENVTILTAFKLVD